jgi:hypothetical protein
LSEILPTGLPFSVIDKALKKKEIGKLINIAFRRCGLKETVVFADKLMQFGFSPEAMFTKAVEVHSKKEAIMGPGALIKDPISAISVGMALMFGTAGLPHILMRFFTVPNAKEARKSVGWATTWIGYFYILTFIIGFGAITNLIPNPAAYFVDGETAKGLVGGGNMAAVHLANAVGGNWFMGFISAVAFATILAVVAGLTLSGASAVSHDLYASVWRHGRVDQAQELRGEIELVRGASHALDLDAYLAGRQTPVFFGSAINNFGVRELLDAFVEYAPAPRPRQTAQRLVSADEEKFTGFVFKIQANMDPMHRDRVAFLRVCSGGYRKGMRMHQVRLGKAVQISNAITFQADERRHVEEAWPGDIIGLHNHGTIQIGDTFTEGEDLKYEGIPYFAPELFRRVVLKDPLKTKQLQKGVLQLCEEGATQVFRPLKNNDLILGAVGVLQFDVAAFRLKDEYGVDAVVEPVGVYTARWVECADAKTEQQFRAKAYANLAEDGDGRLVYLAPTRVNIDLTVERWPDVRFTATREL